MSACGRPEGDPPGGSGQGPPPRANFPASRDEPRRSAGERMVRQGAQAITEDDLRRLAEAEAEFQQRFEKPGPIGHVLSEVLLLHALVKDYWHGRYRQVPWWAIASVAFSLLYLLNPIDLLPDMVPVLGQLDDALVIAACLLLVEQELQSYKVWKKQQLPEA